MAIYWGTTNNDERLDAACHSGEFVEGTESDLQAFAMIYVRDGYFIVRRLDVSSLRQKRVRRGGKQSLLAA